MKKKLGSKLLAVFMSVAIMLAFTPMLAVDAFAQTNTYTGTGIIGGSSVTGADIGITIDYSKLSKNGASNFGDRSNCNYLLSVTAGITQNGVYGKWPVPYYSESEAYWTGSEWRGNNGYYFSDGTINLSNNDNRIILEVGKYSPHSSDYNKGTPDWKWINYTVYLEYNTVTYALNDSTESLGGVPTREYKYQDQAMNLTTERPTKPAADGTAYTFIGWTTVKNGTTVQYAPGTEYGVNKDMTLYPVWSTEKSYDVTFDLNATTASPYYFSGDSPNYVTTTKETIVSGYTASEPTSVSKQGTTDKFNFDSSLTYKDNKTTYIFNGWNTKADGSGDTWNFNDSKVNKATTLYAQWKKVQNYDVTFDLNATTASPYYFTKDGDNYVTTKTTTAESGTTISEPESVLKKEASGTFKFDSTLKYTDNNAEYTFNGWNTKSDGTGDKWSFNDSKVTKATTLYAQWKKVQSYAVSYNINSDAAIANNFTAPATEYVVEGKEATAPTSPISTDHFTYEGKEYYFNGWNTKQDGTGDYWSFTTNTVDKDITLYAQWGTEKYYTVVFDDNVKGSSLERYVYAKEPIGNTTVANFDGTYTDKSVLESAVAPCPKFYRVDYNFDGWSTNSRGSDTYLDNKTIKANFDSLGTIANTDNTITLYAKWSPKYSSGTSVKIKTNSLTDGTYAEYYSKYIKAQSNDANKESVYRNFVIVDEEGDTADSQSLGVKGLYLNRCTGEVYGAPEEDGDFTFNVRVCNDDGTWISDPVKVSIHIDKADLSVDLNNTEYSKVYGENDPDGLNVLSINLVTSTSKVDGVSVSYNNSDGTMTVLHDYQDYINDQYDNSVGFDPEDIDTYMYASDPQGYKDHTVRIFDKINVKLGRVTGEDAGMYKRYLSTFDGADNGHRVYYFESNSTALGNNVAWTETDLTLDNYYNVSEGALGNTDSKDAEGNSYADNYFLKITEKPDVEFTAKEYTYGELAAGDKVNGDWNNNIVCDANGNVGDKVGIEDIGTAKVASADKLTAKGLLSGAGKLKATKPGTPSTPYSTADALVFSSTNNWSALNPGSALSTTKSDVTTADYKDPSLSLTVNKRTVTAEAAAPKTPGTVMAGTKVVKSDIEKLIKLSAANGGNTGVINGDDVSIDVTKAAYIINGKSYSYSNALKQLTNKAAKSGNYNFQIVINNGKSTGVLAGKDAENYSIDQTVNVKLHVAKGILLAKAGPAGKNSIRTLWKSVDGAGYYVVYGSPCSKSLKKLKTVKAGKSLAYTQKKLKRHQAYKYYVVAYNTSGKVIAKSRLVHSITSKTFGKYAEVTKLTVTPKSVVFTKAGKSKKISSKIKVYKEKKALNHSLKFRYLSNDSSIAKVSNSGRITSVSAGTCTIYVQAINGMWKGISVTVK